MNLERRLNEIRANFSHLDEMIYLGAAGSGPFSLIVYNSVK